MVITDYRVQSVLRTYTKQLQRSKLAARPDSDGADPKSKIEKVSISEEGRRRMMMERLTNQVFEKVYSQEENGTGSTADGQDRQPVPAMKGT